MSNHAFLKRRDGNPVTLCEYVGVDRVKVSVDGRHLIISLADGNGFLPLTSRCWPTIERLSKTFRETSSCRYA